jgi:ribosome-binding protein aMBF1 (putative translation factor)
MPRPHDKHPPIGDELSAEIATRSAEAEYREEAERLAGFERLARVVILRRAQLGLTQADLAARMKTTPSVISRIESGQHATSSRTLKRLAKALDGRAVIGFDFGSAKDPNRELVEL